jgi:hypothetical protein
MLVHRVLWRLCASMLIVAGTLALSLSGVPAHAADPIKVGLSLSLTGARILVSNHHGTRLELGR